MANEFSKASFVAARRLYFEQIAANTNSPIDSRRSNDRLKRNALSDGNIAEDNISSPPYEYYSTLHKASSHSSLIPTRNNELRSKLLNSNSKIPIPGSHSPLVKSINVDSEDSVGQSKSEDLVKEKVSKGKSPAYQNAYDTNYISYIKEMANPSNKKSSENNMPEKIPDTMHLEDNELPETPTLKPTPVASPSITNSKLPIPTSLKNSQGKIDNVEKDESVKDNSNDNTENKGWFSFTREKAPGWFALAREKVNSTNSWFSMSRPRPEQEQEQESIEIKNENKNEELNEEENNSGNVDNENKDNLLNQSTNEDSTSSIQERSKTPVPINDNSTSTTQVRSKTPVPTSENHTSTTQVRSKTPVPTSENHTSTTQVRSKTPVPTSENHTSTTKVRSKTPVPTSENHTSTTKVRSKTPVPTSDDYTLTTQVRSKTPVPTSENHSSTTQVRSKTPVPTKSPLHAPTVVRTERRSSLQSPLLVSSKTEVHNESQINNRSPSLKRSQTQPQSPLHSPAIVRTQIRNEPPQSPMHSPALVRTQVQKQPQSPLHSPAMVRTQVKNQAPSPVHSPSQTRNEIQTISKSPVQSPIQSPVQSPVHSPLHSPAQVRVQVSTKTHSPSNTPTFIKIVNEATKEKIEKPQKISSATNEEILKSPTTRPINKIFNNTQNFVYRSNSLTEKLDDGNMTGDELIIDDKDLTSATIAFDKKVLQKIDNTIPQERNDNEVMTKIQRKKRASFGSSSLSKTINEDSEEDRGHRRNDIIREERVRNRTDDPMYKYLRNKNDIVHQNFNTEKNRYEDDSDASSCYEDSDGYMSNENENRKESFEDRLKMKSKYFINGRKSSVGDKKSAKAIVSKNIKPSLPVPVLPARKSSTSNLTSKIRQDSNIPVPSAKPVNPSQTITSPPTRSLSTTSNGSAHVRATSPLTMYSRVNEDLNVENKPKTYNIVKTEPIMIDSKPERVLKYKPPRRTSSSLSRNAKHLRNKKSQDDSINENSSIFIDAPPERGRSIFKENREFSNKSHSIDTELSRRGNGREGRNRSPDYRLKPGMNERGRGRTRKSMLHEFDDDDDDDNIPLMINKGINTRKYLKKYLDRREGQRSQSLDTSKSKSHRRNDSDDYLKINDELNDDTMYITELLNTNFLDQDNGKENIFYSNKLTPRTSSVRHEKHSSTMSSASSISSVSSTSSSASSMTNSTTDLNKNTSVNNNKSFINDAPIDSYYRVSGVIKHSVVPIGNPSILYGEDSSYNSLRSKNTLYNSRSSITLNRYSYQKSNRNSAQKRISSSSTAVNDDETSLIFGNLPEEIYNFLKSDLDVPAPSRTSSRESMQSSSDSKRQSLSSLHQSLTLNDESDNDEVTLKNSSSRLQPSTIKEEVTPKPLTNAQKRIQKITSEILSTERTYVKELNNLINIYIEPLKKNNLLEQEEFNSIFANIEDIYMFHAKSFLPPLETVCSSNDAKISKFFLEISGSFENFYSKYYYAFNGANTLLSLVQANNNHNVRIPNLSSSAYILNLPLFERSSKKRLKKFRNFLKNCTARPDHTQLSLQGYLILPVQRLPRYLLLIEQLVKYSKDNPEEKEENEKAAELMKNVVESCNSYMKQCEEKHVLLEITTKHIRLDSNDSHGEMVDNYIKIQGLIRVPGAKLIRKGDLQILRSVTSNASIFPSKRLSSEIVGRNPNLINPNVRCSSALSMVTTTTNSSSRTYYDSKSNGSRLSSSNESIHSVSTNATYVQPPPTTPVVAASSNYKRSSTSVLDLKKNQTTDSIGMFYLIHNLFIYCKLDGILVNVLDLENCTEEPASFSSTSSEFVEIESKKTDIVLIVSDCKTQLYLTSPDIDSVYGWHQTINKQWRALKKIEK